ncbi:flagellar hook-length control protein FliK [Rhizobium hidalgonense]|uniref:flagellar hook-length control protein FliK n=1 Tax=Rhizobium hidalgonense TaxID=1538159 RepID=UPI0028716795|nr:flagellar hook-length control protein FliK [Rhizobium hidalgonense]MDR9807599.1 flagellar hook-length control protein FliK [Rhizobium hidalgonense]
MMDMSVLGGAAGAESAAAAKSARPIGKDDAAGQKNGFSDALAKASNGAVNDDADDAQPDQGAVAEAGAEPARTIRSRSGAKPLIDLGDAALKAQAEVQPETIANVVMAAVKSGKAAVKMPAGLAFGKLDAKESSAEEVVQAAKGGKHAKADGLQTDTDQDGEDDDGGISDVLGLLKQDPSDGAVALQAAAGAHHASAQADEVKTAGKKIEGADAKAGGHASDALAAVSGNADSGKADEVRVPGSESAEAADGRTFRISRADGRGVSMDVHLGTDQAAPKDGAKKADIENVSVLESRRYIGLMQNSNSAAVTAALSGDSEWARAMEPSSALSNAAEFTSTGKVVNTLKIQMNPLDLGMVTATMRLSGDALNVDLKVETGSAYRQMKEDHGKILEALRSQGYAVDNVTISMAPVERSDAGNQAGSQSQASQQQSLAQQRQGGEARERHNQTAQRTDGGFNGAGETGIEDVSAGRSGGTGGVYL